MSDRLRDRYLEMAGTMEDLALENRVLAKDESGTGGKDRYLSEARGLEAYARYYRKLAGKEG